MSYEIDLEGNETRVLHELCDFGGKDVLEVGCGDGRMTWRYAHEARSVLGLDPNAAWIDRAISVTPDDLRSTVTFRAADVTTAKLPAESIDVVILSWSL